MTYKQSLTKENRLDEKSSIRALKEKTGQKVIGYLCCFAPLELISAAGATSYRITGVPAKNNQAADRYLEPYGCPYVRNIMALAAEGVYDDLDGLVISHSCDMVQRLYGIWTYYHPFSYSYLFNVPHQTSAWAKRFFKRELHFFKESLEKFTGLTVTDERLAEEIKLYNKNRQLVQDIFNLRLEDPPRVEGSEVLDLIFRGSKMPPADFTLLLQERIAYFKQRKAPVLSKKRLLVWGSLLDHPAFYEMIEESLGTVVADDTCLGFRTFEKTLPLTKDPYDGLTEHYFTNFLCPRTDRGPGYEKYRYLLERIKKYRVQGVVAYIMSFCDPHKFDYADLRDLFKAENIPLLLIDDHYSFEPKEAIKTRLEAFLEMI